MTKLRRKNNPISTKKIGIEAALRLIEASRADEALRGRAPGYHQTRYSVPMNNKGRCYR